MGMNLQSLSKRLALIVLAVLVIFLVYMPTTANAKDVGRGFDHQKSAAAVDQAASDGSSQREYRDLESETEELLEEEGSGAADFFAKWKWLIIGLLAPGLICCGLCCFCFCCSCVKNSVSY